MVIPGFCYPLLGRFYSELTFFRIQLAYRLFLYQIILISREIFARIPEN